ncbi:hypothetical protein [Halohasta salina]|uniref:hypothetical protein n=1 Tax=Halohasta salina TaxID=2961621 RepID=UPI0020A4ECDB|nr:hypothetical protein [Halohasta salina]
MNWKGLIKNPVAWLTGGLGGVFLFDPTVITALLAALWSSAGTLFTAASVAAFTVIPQVDALSSIEETAVAIAVVAGGIYLAKLGYRILDSYTDRL